jgi:hypothetical protein
VACTPPSGASSTSTWTRHHAGGASATDTDGDDFPWVVEYRGERYVLDGHHRTVVAIDNNAPLPAHIMRVPPR